MAYNARGLTANELYKEIWWKTGGLMAEEDSRNGPVYTMEQPFHAVLAHPRHRVLFAPTRRPNPAFHLMEAIWMLAGEHEVEWLTQFNSHIADYAEPADLDIDSPAYINGAYGYRWRNQWMKDQLVVCSRMLKDDPTTRQAVLSMWDPDIDLDTPWFRDRPCNTHIYFRNVRGKLHMTVCNRSNDLVWGMMGSNIVHMTFLQEWMAWAAGLSLGEYRVFTNNLHVYPEKVDYEALRMEGTHLERHHIYEEAGHLVALKHPDHDPREFLSECEAFCNGSSHEVEHPFLKHVALPMKEWYLAEPRNRKMWRNMIVADDWRLAAEIWDNGRSK